MKSPLLWDFSPRVRVTDEGLNRDIHLSQKGRERRIRDDGESRDGKYFLSAHECLFPAYQQPNSDTLYKLEGKFSELKQIFNYHLNPMSPETIFLSVADQDGRDTFAPVNGPS